MKKAMFTFSIITVILLLSSTVVFAKPPISDSEGVFSIGPAYLVDDISNHPIPSDYVDNDGDKPDIMQPPLEPGTPGEDNDVPQNSPGPQPSDSDVGLYLLGEDDTLHMIQGTVTVAPAPLQMVIGGDAYNSLSAEDQQEYVSVGESLWVRFSAIRKLVNKGLIEAIGTDEYLNLSEEEREGYVMSSKSFWVSKTDLYQLFHDVVYSTE